MKMPLFHKRPFTRDAFTLVELLTSIAIIAILAGILFPVLQSTLSKARTSKCNNNLRQIGVAVGMYVSEHCGQLPIGFCLEAPSFTNNWGPLISVYLGYYALPRNWDEYWERMTSGVFRCPELADADAYKNNSYRWNFNLQRGTANTALYLTEVPNPSMTLMVAEKPGYPLFANLSGISFPHDGKGNCLFVDGHVEILSSEEMEKRASDGSLIYNP